MAIASPFAEIPAAVRETLRQSDQSSTQVFEDQRRMNLLRFIVPALYFLALIVFPFALWQDLRSLPTTFSGSIEVGIVLVGFGSALWSMRHQHVDLAAIAVFTSVTLTLFYVLYDSILQDNVLSLGTWPLFTMLLFPIVIAGILGTPLMIVLTTSAMFVSTFAMIALVPHDVGMKDFLNGPNGITIYTIPLVLQAALGVLIFASNTSLRRTQQELNLVRLAYARERELDRLKNMFISNVNHELRTPIMSLQGYLTLARDMSTADQTQQRYLLDRGQEVLKNLTNLVDAILDVRRIEAIKTKTMSRAVPVLAAVNSAIALLDPSYIHDPERPISVAVAPDLLARGDQTLLIQVILNVLTNACKYSDPGTPIEIAARVHSPAPATGKLSAPSSPLVEIFIRDHGLGIPPDQIPLLFERFVRLERDITSQVPGTGLGLAICRAYVEVMGGTIQVSSRGIAGEGSTFIITLRRASSPV